MTDDIRLSIENLAADGSNWVSYRDRMVWTIESRRLAEHLAEASMTQTYINTGTVGHLLPQARWNMDNGIVKRLIGASVPNTIFLQIKSKTNVKEVWDALKALYETRSELAVVQLMNCFQSTKCGEDDNVRTHYELLADLQEQLAAMGKTITDREYVGTLMGSLPPSYESVLSAISSSCFINQQALTSAMVLKLVLESFDRRQAANASKAKDEAFTTEAQKVKAKNVKPQMECFNCKKHGHIKANCWAKGGGKEGQGPKRRESRDAGDKRGNATGQRSAATVKQTPDEAWATIEITEEQERAKLSPHVAALVASQKSGTIWDVYDSGASRHISPIQERFVTYESIAPRPIMSSNSQVFHAIGQGDIYVDIPNGATSSRALLRNASIWRSRWCRLAAL